MNLAAIVYEFPSTSETFVLGQLRGLRELGCDVSVFADSVDASVPSTTANGNPLSVSYFGLPFKSLREQYGKAMSASGSAGLQRQSNRVVTAAKDVAAGMRLGFEARAFGRNAAFDVIHAHFGPNGVRAVRLRKRKVIRGAIVTSFYGYDVGRSWARNGYHELFIQGDCFIALSDHMRGKLIELGCPADRIVVHRLGVDPDQFKLKTTKHSATLEILSVARLVPKKGIEYALRAAAILASQNVKFRYTVVGDGPLRPKLEQIASTLGLSDKVRFAGAQPHETIAALLSASDVLLAPSVTAPDGDAEGTPVAILEAAASGLPVVASHHTGIPEIVQDGVSGFLVEERDASSIAAKLMELAADHSQRAAMGREGRAIVAARHDIRVLNRELLRILERVREEYQRDRFA